MLVWFGMWLDDFVQSSSSHISSKSFGFKVVWLRVYRPRLKTNQWPCQIACGTQCTHMPKSSSNHDEIILKSWQNQVKLMITSCSNHTQIMLNSWRINAKMLPNCCQNHTKNMPISCQSHAKLYTNHAKIMPKSWTNHAKNMPKSCQI